MCSNHDLGRVRRPGAADSSEIRVRAANAAPHPGSSPKASLQPDATVMIDANASPSFPLQRRQPVFSSARCLARISLSRLCSNGNPRDPESSEMAANAPFRAPSQGVREAHEAISAAGHDAGSMRDRGTGCNRKTHEAHKKRPALNAGLFEVRYSLHVAKWPGMPPTPGGWGADVFRYRGIPSHRGNTGFIAGQLGRHWASLRRKCGFCDLSIAADSPAGQGVSQLRGRQRPAPVSFMTLA